MRRRVAADGAVVALHVERTRGAIAGLRGALRRVPLAGWMASSLLAGLLVARLPVKALATLAATSAAWSLRLARTPLGALAFARASAARARRRREAQDGGVVDGHRP